MPAPIRRARLWLALLAIAAASVAIVVATRPIAKNFGVVEAGHVYRAGRMTPASLGRVVREHHVKTVIDLGADPEGSPRDLAVRDAAAALGVRRLTLRLEGDGTGDPNMYVQALRALADPSNEPTLVHCGAGAQRTGAAVALYRHIVQGEPMDKAYAEACDYGHDPKKDVALRRYLDQWADEIERAFREGGTIAPDGSIVAANGARESANAAASGEPKAPGPSAPAEATPVTSGAAPR